MTDLNDENFDQPQAWMIDMEPKEAYPLVDRIMADDDANDPTPGRTTLTSSPNWIVPVPERK